MISIEGLEAFVAIAELRSFSRAADRLGVVQSVASKRLARLEDQLGTVLIDRSVKADIALTRIGGLYLPEARAALAQLAGAEQIGRNLARGSAGPLRIGFVFSAALNGTLTTMLAGVRASLAGMELQPRLLETPEQIRALQDGRIDIGLMRPRPAYPVNCRSHVIASEALSLFMASTHRLAGCETVEAGELASERFIVPQFEELVGLIESISRLARAGGFSMPEIVRTGDFVTAASLAAAGEGIALAPASLRNFGLGGMVAKEIVDYAGTVDMVLVHREDAPALATEAAVRCLRDAPQMRAG